LNVESCCEQVKLCCDTIHLNNNAVADEMIERTTFLSVVIEAVRKTEQVLLFYGMAPKPESELKLEPYVRALSVLCGERSKGFEGIANLQRFQEVLERMPAESVTPEEFLNGQRTVERYAEWLVATFPEESGSRCRWPLWRRWRLTRLSNLCERCRERDATVHLTISSNIGMKRHEYCESCYREIEPHESASTGPAG
jgi:hypothetical protein